MNDRSLDDLLDALVARYSDDLEAGVARPRGEYLAEVPADARPGLERCLKMIESGTAQTPAAGQPLVPGLRIDHYELVRELGRGGMALVWLARDTELDRAVALKVLRPGLALERRHADRFRREALAIARLKHPHIVQIHGAGEAYGYHYLAMEFVEGPSLATVLEALPTDREPTAENLARATGIPSLGMTSMGYEQAVAHLLAPVAEALEAAHHVGLVHRDMKPSNVLIHRDGRAVLADFGLAKGDDDPALSLTGDALGTPYYMSPEQAYVTGQTVDHRTDIYSLGVTLYEALAGVRPFGGNTFLEVIEAIRSTQPPAIKAVAPRCTRNASAVVRKAMARQPKDRYESAAAMRDDLVAIAEDRSSEAMRSGGGFFRRAWTEFRLATSGFPYEYRSARTFLGLPLVHVISGRRLPGQKMRVAKGWFATGDIAIGGIACGAFAFGGITWGAIAGGVFTWAGIGLGAFTCAGLGIGLFAFAGIAIGWLAMGGIAIGYGALGGLAYGHYAAGGSPHGEHVIREGQADPEAEAFFDNIWEGLADWMGAV